MTGDRSDRNRKLGYEWAHSIVDDHSRLAHSELHPDERADTVVGFVSRVLADYERRGIVVKRLMTDNHFSYTRSGALKELLLERGIRHITTQAYRPQTNGKVERFQQTMAREWGYGLAHRPQSTGLGLCHTGCATTTSADPTRRSGTGRRSVAFTTYPVRTPRPERDSAVATAAA